MPIGVALKIGFNKFEAMYLITEVCFSNIKNHTLFILFCPLFRPPIAKTKIKIRYSPDFWCHIQLI